MLLHICCGICAAGVVERLREDKLEPVGFFYNPNIHPREEYLKRQATAKEMARILKFDLISGRYDKDNWMSAISGLENEPEGGGRCSVCFRIRLRQAALKAKELGLEHFTTTLTVSSHKSTDIINKIGGEIDSTLFLIRDFKKDDGFRLAMAFSKRYNLYQQDYCGCIYSGNSKNIK
ncbi:epoxyqueuosine reductase QueH [Candidatus Omnitrophota bacterium]